MQNDPPRMTSSPAKPEITWTVAGVVTAVALVVMFGVVPYSFGYGSRALPLSGMLWALWNDSGDWQHGMVVPLICAGLIYWKRRELAAIPIRGDTWGVLPLLLSLFLFWAGYKSGVQYIGFASAQLLIASLVIWFLGWRFFKAVMFPWAFLGFMWPFIFLEQMIAFPLRIQMAGLSHVFLNLVGVETILNGSGILSAADPAAGLAAGERFQVDIANPCSGIRSLFALTMISAIYGYIMLRSNWKRWLFFLLAVPLAVFGNFCRILMLVFGTMHFGAKFAIGSLEHPSTYHLCAGLLVFAVALMGMVALARLLQGKKKATPDEMDFLQTPDRAASPS